ncbi:MAG: outer membrane protein assembly factor BamA [Nitrospirota bacterium]
MIALSVPAAAQETPVVNTIEVRGLKRIDESSVRAKISHGTGESLSSEKVTADIQKIYEMGYFDDVRVEVEPFEGGVGLIYIVREKPVITRVDFQGNKKLDDEKLREQLTITPGSIADTVLIQDNAIKIGVMYSNKGYALAEVVPVVRRISDTQAALTYQIDEGKKVKVKKIRVEGNEAFSDRKIRGVMQTGKWSIFNFLTHKKGYYEKNRIAADVERIKNLYFDNGYIQAAVTGPEIEYTDEKRKMILDFRVSEGEQFDLSSVGISGNTVFTEEEIRENLESEPGQVFSRGGLQKDVAAITDMYGERGYATANVVPDVVPDEASREVDVDLRIQEGDIYTIGRISISGNNRTRDRVIRREVRLDEGETYNGKLLKRSYQRISNTNYFEDVSFLPRFNHKIREVDVDIDVKERRTGSISLGAGYSSIDKLVGMVEFTQGNFRGMGQTLKIRAELGSIASDYSVSFIEPWLFGRPVSFSASVYNTEREYVDYDRKATGFSLGLGKELSEYWKANVVYNLEEAEITDVGPTASQIILDQVGKRLTSSISPSIIRDSRNNFLDPSRGSRTSLVVNFAGLGGDNKFVKGVLDSQWFFPVTERTVLAIRGRYGHATGYGGEEVPLYERFYVGGIHTIRGLDFGEGGPRDDTGEVIGGLNMVILNTDFVFPLIPSINLKGVVFSDVGSAYDNKFEELRYTAGAGVRWISPVGPIRIEWGYNIDPKPDEAGSRVEFALGTFF